MQEMCKLMYYTYILRCSDNSLYTGITTDVVRRYAEHINGGKGAKYTKAHKPIKIECVWRVGTKSDASRLESRIKKLTKQQKEQLVNGMMQPSEFFDVDVEKVNIQTNV